MSDVVTLPRLMTEEQVAQYLGVHRETVARQRRAKKLPFRRIGGLIRFTPSDVQEYLERCASTSSPAAESGKSAGPTPTAPQDVSALALEIAGKRTSRSPATS